MRLGLSPDLSSLASLRFPSGGFGVSTASTRVSKMPARSRSQDPLHSQLGKGGCPAGLEGQRAGCAQGAEQQPCSGERGSDRLGGSEGTGASGSPGEGSGRRGLGTVQRAGLKGTGKRERKR